MTVAVSGAPAACKHARAIIHTRSRTRTHTNTHTHTFPRTHTRTNAHTHPHTHATIHTHTRSQLVCLVRYRSQPLDLISFARSWPSEHVSVFGLASVPDRYVEGFEAQGGGGAALAKGLNNPCPGFMTGSDCRDDYWADEPVDATLIECLAFNAPLAELISLFDEAALDFLIKRFVFIALFC